MAQVNENETSDDVLEESRRIKESLAKSMNFDVDRIVQDARAKQLQSGRKIISSPVRQDS
jgi:hypothetical protein